MSDHNREDKSRRDCAHLNQAHHNQEGVALVAVLWFVLLLSLMATSLMAANRGEFLLWRRGVAQMQANAAAEAGISLAVLWLGTVPLASDWRLDGTPRDLGFDQARLSVSIVSEAGKIDLNKAELPLLRGAFIQAGASTASADALADTIADWRDPATGLHRLNSLLSGAPVENGDLRPRHGPFQSVAELSEVPGITSELYDRAAPLLTVASGVAEVDTNVAAREVLLAMPGTNVADADAIIAQRARSAAATAVLSGQRTRVGQAYTIRSAARLPDGTMATRKETIRLTGNTRDPIWVLDVE